jgi:uncharacterized membrane protein
VSRFGSILSPLKRIDIKYIILFIVLCVGFFVSYCNRSNLLESLTLFFEFKYLNILAGALSAIVVIVHKIKYRKLNFKPSMTFFEFNAPFSETIFFALNPIAIVCSLSLAKALFLQCFKQSVYFNFFSATELTFIGIVTAYLLYSSLMELYGNLKEIVLKDSAKSETPLPTTEPKNKNT